MNYTRKYFEELLDVFEAIVRIKNGDYKKLNSLKNKLNSLLIRIQKYDIFNIEIPKTISTEIDIREEDDFIQTQSKIAEFLYNTLGGLIFTFERTEREADYATSLEIYRTELPFDVVAKWNIQENKSNEFSMDFLFFDMNKKWTNIDNEIEYKKYKKELRAKELTLRYPHKPIKINKKKLDKLSKLYQSQLDDTIKYIETHYPNIKREFSLYDSNIRMYIIDRKGVPGETTKQTKIYKDLTPKNKVEVYPYLLNLATRFNNLEEIEGYSQGYSESLFDIDNPEKYGHDFDIRLVYFELLFIFLKNCDKYQKKEFLKYLIRCNLSTRVNESDDGDLMISFDKKCKLLIDNTPNLSTIKKMLKDGVYSYVAFTNRPDDETLKYLNQLNVKNIVIEQIARDYINIGNGLIIHYFIKDNLFKIKVDRQYQNRSHELISKLKNCPVGIKGWAEFEEICTEIFEYLFGDNFRKYTHKLQSYTNDGILRRDLVINNNFNDTTSIWGQAKLDFNCNLIVIDFKNYSEPLEQNEFYLPSKYLNIKTGKFGILMTRKGLGNSAKLLQKRMLNLNNELLISLTEDDLVQMIEEKSLNQDPSYRLENIKFSLFDNM